MQRDDTERILTNQLFDFKTHVELLKFASSENDLRWVGEIEIPGRLEIVKRLCDTLNLVYKVQDKLVIVTRFDPPKDKHGKHINYKGAPYSDRDHINGLKLRQVEIRKLMRSYEGAERVPDITIDLSKYHGKAKEALTSVKAELRLIKFMTDGTKEEWERNVEEAWKRDVVRGICERLNLNFELRLKDEKRLIRVSLKPGVDYKSSEFSKKEHIDRLVRWEFEARFLVDREFANQQAAAASLLQEAETQLQTAVNNQSTNGAATGPATQKEAPTASAQPSDEDKLFSIKMELRLMDWAANSPDAQLDIPYTEVPDARLRDMVYRFISAKLSLKANKKKANGVEVIRINRRDRDKDGKPVDFKSPRFTDPDLIARLKARAKELAISINKKIEEERQRRKELAKINGLAPYEIDNIFVQGYGENNELTLAWRMPKSVNCPVVRFQILAKPLAAPGGTDPSPAEMETMMRAVYIEAVGKIEEEDDEADEEEKSEANVDKRKEERVRMKRRALVTSTLDIPREKSDWWPVPESYWYVTVVPVPESDETEEGQLFTTTIKFAGMFQEDYTWSNEWEESVVASSAINPKGAWLSIRACNECGAGEWLLPFRMVLLRPPLKGEGVYLWGMDIHHSLGQPPLQIEDVEEEEVEVWPTPNFMLARPVVDAALSHATHLVFPDGKLYSWGCLDTGASDYMENKVLETPSPILLHRKNGMEWDPSVVVYSSATGGIIPRESAHMLASKDVIGSHVYSAAVSAEGELYMWGYNAEFQCTHTSVEPDGFAPLRRVPLPHEPFTLGHRAPWLPAPAFGLPVLQVACGVDHALCLAADNTVWQWGKARGVFLTTNRMVEEGEEGRVTLGPTQNIETIPPQHLPRKVKEFDSLKSKVVAISAGGHHAAALLQDGALYTWGENEAGQLGHGLNFYRELDRSFMCPRKVEDIPPLRWINMGFAHSGGIDKEGKVYTWGSNTTAALGMGTASGDPAVKPALVTGIGNKPCTRVWCGVGATIFETLEDKAKQGYSYWVCGKKDTLPLDANMRKMGGDVQLRPFRIPDFGSILDRAVEGKGMEVPPTPGPYAYRVVDIKMGGVTGLAIIERAQK